MICNPKKFQNTNKILYKSSLFLYKSKKHFFTKKLKSNFVVMVTMCCNGYYMFSWLLCVMVTIYCHGYCVSWLLFIVMVTVCHGYYLLSWFLCVIGDYSGEETW